VMTLASKEVLFRTLPFVKSVPGMLQGGGAAFATTHWSVVAACKEASPEAADVEAAIAHLCRDYWPPLYSFVRRGGASPADAQDLVQGFFTHFLQNRIYTQGKSEKGKFRTFLLAALKNFMIDHWSKEQAMKRGGEQKIIALECGNVGSRTTLRQRRPGARPRFKNGITNSAGRRHWSSASTRPDLSTGCGVKGEQLVTRSIPGYSSETPSSNRCSRYYLFSDAGNQGDDRFTERSGKRC